MRMVRDAHGAKKGGRPIARFPFECACGQGTDSRLEFEGHLLNCPMILDGVRAVIQRKLAAGETVVVPSASPPGDREGQMEIDGLPPPIRRRRR